MEHMQGLMSRERSDAFVDRIEAHWESHGWGLWAVEVPGVAPFIGYVGLWPAGYVTGAPMVEVTAILERTGAREYTRDQARRFRDEALSELDAAGVVRPEARARLEEIIVSAISA